MRGYFAIGIEKVSKPGNVGNLIRTAHGFGAAFAFTVAANYTRAKPSELDALFSDTARSSDAAPFYAFDRIGDLVLPAGCRLVGVELSDDAVDLPSFRHPPRAAYILGGERLGLSPQTLERCHHVIKIPTRFSLNVATAGAVVMYDRMIGYGRFAERPVSSGARPEPLAEHVHGGPIQRRAGAKT